MKAQMGSEENLSLTVSTLDLKQNGFLTFPVTKLYTTKGAGI